MMSVEDPAFEDAFTPDEIQELLSVVQTEMPITQSSSGSDTTTTRSIYSQEERKRRRMMSNRESARRSRWRKKRQVEELADEEKKLKLENRELQNRLSSITSGYYMVQRESGRLLAEAIDLKHKLAGLYQILATHHHHQQQQFIHA